MHNTIDTVTRAARLDPRDPMLGLRMEAEQARQGLAALKKGAIRPDAVLGYVLGGDATLTLESLRTGQHLTYRVRQKTERKRGADGRRKTVRHPFWFVDLMTGSDNIGGFTFLGTIGKSHAFKVSAKSRFQAHDPAALAFGFMLRHAVAGLQAQNLAVWHDGRCGRCRRTLTVPASLETGIGPVCETKERTSQRAPLTAKSKEEGEESFRRLFSSLARRSRAS